MNSLFLSFFRLPFHLPMKVFTGMSDTFSKSRYWVRHVKASDPVKFQSVSIASLTSIRFRRPKYSIMFLMQYISFFKIASSIFKHPKVPQSKTESKTLGFWPVKSGPIIAKAWVDKTGYVPGETIYFNGHVENQSGKPMRGSRIQIVEVCSTTYSNSIVN